MNPTEGRSPYSSKPATSSINSQSFFLTILTSDITINEGEKYFGIEDIDLDGFLINIEGDGELHVL